MQPVRCDDSLLLLLLLCCCRAVAHADAWQQGGD
jgi:hypothetical protein